ncbi:hypothetical protein [Bacillus sp. SDLI1]|uniref:hypothetical protein n=1 Tax=Bacillus sp. SDLI1 TaxID=1774743 RepID=UPI00076849C6|nr:hypothetical protein [Bacillus sp. SDLI1]AME04821.1 hypothetical protein AUL54_00020 [Bacillus sp. SDLI1]
MIAVNGKKVEFTEFPNGELNLNHKSIDVLANSDSATNVGFKFENNTDLIKLMFVKRYLDQLKIKTTSLSISYMPYSRMDRSENGSPFTLKYVAQFINELGFSEIEVYEPHSDVTTALLNRVQPNFINFNLINLVKRIVRFDENKDYLMFPDAGASKRYSRMKAKNVLVGHKHRDFETGEIKGLELVGDIRGANGRQVIIVDDLSSRGGTFVHSSKKLREHGFSNVFLLVAHAENTIFKGELFNHIDTVFTTDSILTEQNNWENKKYESKLKVYNI